MPRIDTLLLDADGVVQQPVAGWLDQLADLCGSEQDRQDFLQHIFTAEKPCLRGAADWPVVLGNLLTELNSPASLEAALAVWTRIEPAQEVLNMLPRIRVPVCLATNQQPHRAAFMKNTLGYEDQFDRLFISCEMGVCKPEPEYFAAIAATLDCEPAALLFIDDHMENVSAARKFGLQAERYHLESGTPALAELLERYGLL